MRQLSPFAPRIHQIQHCIRQFPLTPCALAHSPIQWRYLFPLFIGQVAGMPLSPVFFHTPILPLPYPLVNTGSKQEPPQVVINNTSAICFFPVLVLFYEKCTTNFPLWEVYTGGMISWYERLCWTKLSSPESPAPCEAEENCLSLTGTRKARRRQSIGVQYQKRAVPGPLQDLQRLAGSHHPARD